MAKRKKRDHREDTTFTRRAFHCNLTEYIEGTSNENLIDASTHATITLLKFLIVPPFIHETGCNHYTC